MSARVLFHSGTIRFPCFAVAGAAEAQIYSCQRCPAVPTRRPGPRGRGTATALAARCSLMSRGRAAARLRSPCCLRCLPPPLPAAPGCAVRKPHPGQPWGPSAPPGRATGAPAPRPPLPRVPSCTEFPWGPGDPPLHPKGGSQTAPACTRCSQPGALHVRGARPCGEPVAQCHPTGARDRAVTGIPAHTIHTGDASVRRFVGQLPALTLQEILITNGPWPSFSK